MPSKRKSAELDVVWIEKKAAEARELLGLSESTKINIVDALKRLLAAGVIFGCKVVEDSGLPSADAQWNHLRKTITIRRSVLQAAKSGDARARFTIAHEIGHAFLKHPAQRNRRADGKDFGEMASLQEKEANRFAAAFLSPSKMAADLKLESPRELMRIFGLSAPAAEIRLSEMKEYRRRLARNAEPQVEEEDSYETYMRAVLRQAIAYPDR